MFEVNNATEGIDANVIVRDKTGASVLVVILKYTLFADDFGCVTMSEQAAAPYLIDEWYGDDPTQSSIRKPSDLFDQKPGTDVILIGHAHSPAGATHADVRLRVGPVDKTVRAHGLRVWQKAAFGGVAPGPSRPIREPVPLRYELAWGGLDLSDPQRPVGEWRNTVGRGVSREPASLLDQPAAQLEYLDRAQHQVPAAFGALHRHWQPRVTFAGTYDEAWEQKKMPLLPDDFDERHNVTVTSDQWSSTPLRGDEPIEIQGATPSGTWRFQLPRFTPGFSSFMQGRRTEHRTHLDTLLIDADAQRVELTFRAGIVLPRKYEMLDRVEVFDKQLVWGERRG